jgi:catalase
VTGADAAACTDGSGDEPVAAGITADAPGVVMSDAAGKSFTDQLAAAVGLHRAWDRAPAVMAPAVPPVLTS